MRHVWQLKIQRGEVGVWTEQQGHKTQFSPETHPYSPTSVQVLCLNAFPVWAVPSVRPYPHIPHCLKCYWHQNATLLRSKLWIDFSHRLWQWWVTNELLGSSSSISDMAKMIKISYLLIYDTSTVLCALNALFTEFSQWSSYTGITIPFQRRENWDFGNLLRAPQQGRARLKLCSPGLCSTGPSCLH